METTLDTLELTSKNMDALNKLESRLFDVIDYKKEAPSPIDLGIDPSTEVDAPYTKDVYTSDGRFLGTGGRIYHSLQPKDFLRSIIESVQESQLDLDLSQIGYNEYLNGQRIRFTVPFEPIIFTNANGKEENILAQMSFWTGFGGTFSSKFDLSTKRLVCDNGMRVARSHGQLKMRHTESGNAKALLYVGELLKTMDTYQQHGEFLKSLDRVEVKRSEIVAFARELAGIRTKKEWEEAKARKKATVEQILHGIDIEMKYTGTTAFGLLQGATRYTNHLHKNAGHDFIMIGAGKETNNKAQQLVAEYV